MFPAHTNSHLFSALQVNAFNPATLSSLMCTDTLSVAWDGRLYDCDFNQQLQMVMALGPDAAAASSSSSGGDGSSSSGSESSRGEGQPGLTVWDLDSLDDLTGGVVRVGSHCYGCTAGSGSGCQGATA
jgi:hypothetical protein